MYKEATVTSFETP